ncbi:hypothetical protein [uncultured Treponema sp.]|uniref:hypothetical protein n=1 Tax=uncultured Treponema sp. TaxID=162155 RepID=UPI0025D7F613|nr:hypothetical protein [uncultured Treponema sp.]
MDFSKFDETRSDDEQNHSDERLVFHYNREERLKHAPEIVQDYYSGKFHPYKGGLFKSLVNTRANRLLFVTIIFAFGIILFVNYFGPQKSSGSLAGVDVKLSAFSYEDSVYASLKLDKASKKKLAGFKDGVPVSATFSAHDKEGVVVQEVKVLGKYEGKELFLRTTFSDYDIISIDAVCSMLDSFSSLETQIEKR